MRKYLLYIFFVLALLFSFNSNVYAEDNDNEKKVCTSVEKNKLIKEADSIIATYEFVYNAVNEVIGFNYLLYNIPDNMYVTYTGIKRDQPDDYNADDERFTLDIDRETGTAKLFDDNIDKIYTVRFEVYPRESSCTDSVKVLNIKKLKYNKFADYPQCGFEGMEDFIYCKKWIDTSITINDEQVLKRMNEQIEKNKSKTSTICYSCDENQKNNDIYETIVKIRKYAIIGLIIGIVIDIIVIFVLIKKVGDYEL